MAEVSVGRESVAGVSSLVRSSGPGEAREAVLFLHGNPGSSEDWADLLARTGELARAVAPDMPGFGKADRPRDFDYTVDGYARHHDGLLPPRSGSIASTSSSTTSAGHGASSGRPSTSLGSRASRS